MISLSCFGIKVKSASWNEFGRVSFFSIFCKSKKRIAILFWMFGRIYQWINVVLNFCLLGGFWLLIQRLYRLLVYSDFLCYHDLVLIGFVFLEIYSFLLGSPICWCIIVHSTLMIFCGFFAISCNISCFTFDFIYLSSLSLFPWWV